MTVYIPCFFNDILERKENFKKVLTQYIKLNYSIVLYWMNKEDAPTKSEKIKVIKSLPVNASKARNKLLGIFYNSDENGCILADDDTLLRTDINENLDCVSFTNDFTKGYKETSKISSSLLYLKNLKKLYNTEVYFDENLEANQDLDFGISLNKLGVKTFRKSSEEVEIFKGKSSMFSSNMNRLNKKEKALVYILKKHKNDN